MCRHNLQGPFVATRFGDIILATLPLLASRVQVTLGGDSVRHCRPQTPRPGSLSKNRKAMPCFNHPFKADLTTCFLFVKVRLSICSCWLLCTSLGEVAPAFFLWFLGLLPGGSDTMASSRCSCLCGCIGSHPWCDPGDLVPLRAPAAGHAVWHLVRATQRPTATQSLRPILRRDVHVSC